MLRGYTLLKLSLLFSVVLLACQPLSRPWGEFTIAPDQPILVGFSVDADAALTDPVAVAGAEQDPPQVAGRSIRLVPVPVHCSADSPVATAPTPDAVSGLVGYIGGGCSSGCIYAEGWLFEQRATMIAAGCTAASVVQQGFPTVFRIAWDDTDQTAVAANYARSTLHVSRVAVVRDTSVYARGMTVSFASRFRRRGESTREVEIPVTGTVDTAQLASRIRGGGAGAVFFAVDRPDSAALFIALQASLAPLPVIASDTVLTGGAGLPDGLVATGLARRNGAWVSELDDGVRSPALFDSQVADALRLYVAALNKVAIGRTGGSLSIDRERLRDALLHLDIAGETGRIDFDSRGERRHDTGSGIYRITDGRSTLLGQYKR